MWKEKTVQVKFAQTEYCAGDQVSGEILLHFPTKIEKSLQVDFFTWCVETCEWSHGFFALPSINHNAESKFLTKKWFSKTPQNTSQFTLLGTNLIYFKHGPVWVSPSSVVEEGTYVIPFTYELPHKAPASTEFFGQCLKFSVKHMWHVRLCWVDNRQGSHRKFLTKGEQLNFVQHYNTLMQDFSTLVSASAQLTVVESPSFQPTLKPYSYQCIYSLQSLFFIKSDLTITIKKLPRAFYPGEVIPVNVEILNRTRSLVCCLFLTLRHLVTVKSSTGIYRELIYPVCRFCKPVNVPGRVSESPELITIPFPLPSWISPTAHGVSLSNEWDIVVSSRYSRAHGLNSQITMEDLNIPLCIWPVTVDPARQPNVFSRVTLSQSSEACCYLAPPSVKSKPQISEAIIAEDLPTTTLPVAVLTADMNSKKVLKPESVTRLMPWKRQEHFEKPSTVSNALTYKVYSINEDRGITLSMELYNQSLRREGAFLFPKLSTSHAKRRSITRMKRYIAPIQA